MDKRFDGLELKIDNLTTETRSYHKRSEDRTDSHRSVLKQLSYKVNLHEEQINEIKEKLE